MIRGYLESRVVEFALAKLLESVADFPFEDALAALDELIELLADADLGAAVFEEPNVESFLHVFRRSLRHALGAPKLLHHRHFLISQNKLGFLSERGFCSN